MRWHGLRFVLSLLSLCWANMAYAQGGIDIELSYMGEGVRNISGGIQKGSQYLGTGDLALSLDTEKAGLWQGGTLFIETLVNHGRDPSARFIGDVQTASNIADGNRTRLQQFWYEQTLGEHFSILLGLHDLNSEFYVSEYASWFLNSSFGIGPDVSGNVPTSLFPEAGWAARLDVHGENTYIKMATYDGDPATRAVNVGKEGLMWIAETGFLQGASAYKLGVWHHTANKIAPDGKVYSSDSGVYGVIDQEVSEYIGLFLQLGFTQPKRNEIANYIGAGMHLHGLIPSRHDDVFGIGVARAGFSSINQRVHGITSAETTVEITYDMAVTDYLNIHPAFQWIQHPSGDPALKAAKVAMLRFELHLL